MTLFDADSGDLKAAGKAALPLTNGSPLSPRPMQVEDVDLVDLMSDDESAAGDLPSYKSDSESDVDSECCFVASIPPPPPTGPMPDPPRNVVEQTKSSTEVGPIEVPAPVRKRKKKSKKQKAARGMLKKANKISKANGKKRAPTKTGQLPKKVKKVKRKKKLEGKAIKESEDKLKKKSKGKGQDAADDAESVYPGLLWKRMRDGRCIITHLAKERKGRTQVCNLQDWAFGDRTDEFAEIFTNLFREGKSKEAVHIIKKKLLAGTAVDINGVNVSLV